MPEFSSRVAGTTTSRFQGIPTSSTVPDQSTRMTPRIFASHSSTDNVFGQQLTDDLRKMGYDTWYDSSPGRDASGLVGGDPWWERIQLELTERPIFVVILSPAAMASAWVRDEVSMAWQQKNSSRGKVIIPVLFQGTPVLPALAMLQYGSFLEQRSTEQAFAELLTAIQVGVTREREIAQLPLLPVGPPFEDGLLPVPDPFIGRQSELAWVLELPQPPQLGHAHPRELPLPAVEGLLAHSELAADLRHRRPHFDMA